MKKIFLGIIGVIIFISAILYFTNRPSSIPSELVEEYKVPKEPAEIKEEYDVIVVGGEPEGVAAAVAAARNGKKTLLLEEREGLGGLMTFGMLNFIDMVQGIGGNSAVEGIFKEWHDLVGGKSAFDIEIAQAAFLKLVQDEENITLSLKSNVKKAIFDDSNTIVGLVFENESGVKTVAGKRFIDATQDADFAVMANAPYFIGGEDINERERLMAVTLMIHLEGIDWDGVKGAVDSEKFGKAAIDDNVAWGFNELHYMYEPVEENTRLRGLNLVRIQKKDGPEQYYINALQIFGVNGLDEEAKAQAMEKGKKETEHILAFLREEFPGFENAEIASFPSELYVRETRHIEAEYQLSMADIWMNKDHWDSIGFGGYPVDVQATSVKDYGYVMSSPTQYAIPFRSLVPKEVENLLVVSRSAGYSSIAAGSARIIPTGMAAGEAGGVAASLSIEHNMNFRDLSKDKEVMEELRRTLADQGAKVEHFSIDYPYKDEWFDESVQYLINYGLVVGGYTNDLSVDKELQQLHFSNLLLNGLKRTNMDDYNQYKDKLLKVYENPTANEDTYSRDQLATYLLTVFSSNAGEESGAWEQALTKKLIDEEIFGRVPENRVLTRAEGYYIAARLLQHLDSN